MLNKFVAVYVPGTKHETEPLTPQEHAKAVHKVGAELTAKFGGASAYSVQGFWQSDVHGLVIDNITVIKSFYNGDFSVEEVTEFIHVIAQELKDEFNQEAVTIETESGIDFI